MISDSSNKSDLLTLEMIVSEASDGMRIDQALSIAISDYSRSRIQQWIKAGEVSVNGKLITKMRHAVQTDDQITINASIKAQSEWTAQPLPLNIIFEDEHLLVINKPSGLVVHPAAGHYENTLVNALLHHHEPLALLPRAGLIHRLDKDTTGLLVIAKTAPVHTHLTAMMQAREIKREYQAVVIGQLTAGGTVDEPIGRHPRHRIKMAVVPNGRPSRTHYRIIEKFPQHTHLRVILETGRTHQIRVHMSHINHAVAGDGIYAGRHTFPKGCSPELREALQKLNHQALHAFQLSLTHPITGELHTWEAPLPDYLCKLLAALKANKSEHDDY